MRNKGVRPRVFRVRRRHCLYRSHWKTHGIKYYILYHRRHHLKKIKKRKLYNNVMLINFISFIICLYISHFYKPIFHMYFTLINRMWRFMVLWFVFIYVAMAAVSVDLSPRPAAVFMCIFYTTSLWRNKWTNKKWTIVTERVNKWMKTFFSEN